MASSKGINIKEIKTYTLEEPIINNIIKRILKNYANFFELEERQKMDIITSSVSFSIDSKSEICNWLAHFYHLINSISNQEFDVNDPFFFGDEFAKESCTVALAILKAYLILYRLQNIKVKENDDKFAEIDYDMVDFDFDINDYYLYSESKNGSCNLDYYQEAYAKRLMKNPQRQSLHIKKEIICEVIRNAFAHGNIKCFGDADGKMIIDLKDVDMKKNSIRGLQMTVDKLVKFLDSEAFEPKNCYKSVADKRKI